MRAYLKFLVSYFIRRKWELYKIIEENLKVETEQVKYRVTTRVMMSKLDPNTKLLSFFRAYMSFCHQINQILTQYTFKEIVTNDSSEWVFMPK